MNEQLNDELIDLLTRQASFGLEPAELTRIQNLSAEADFHDDGSFDLAAAAIGLIDIQTDEQLPDHLHARILASGDVFLAGLANETHARANAPANEETEFQKVFTIDPPRRSWNWLGWALAAAACVALAFNVWLTRVDPPQLARLATPSPAPVELTPEQEMASLMASTDLVKASWGVGNVKDLKEIAGEVVWSDSKQKGFMRLRGLPVNDRSKEQYQLWIFDKTQDPKRPIDGGVFDVSKDGEVVIPIDAKLMAQGPSMFAITVEKPGGVVVSDRQKIAALAKVETLTKSST